MTRRGVIVILIAATAPAARANVAVEKKPVTVEHKTFDPAHPPKQMPPLDHGESAVTESLFNCRVELVYRGGDRKRGADGCESSLLVQGVHAELQLRVIIWLPEGAPPKLNAHEEGHRQIAERIYRDAEKIAREVGKALDGRTITGSGDTCAEAERHATRDGAERFCRAYLDRTAVASGKINDVYDDLTHHGTKADPEEAEAIRQAFEKYDQQTKPPRRN